MADLQWLSPFIDSLPKLKKRKKSRYEIAGFPYWENVNSNVIAFYFNEEEYHGFGRLFLNALLQLVIRKNGNMVGSLELFETQFDVKRELDANGKRIDLLLESKGPETEDPSWAIIIENKIYAGLYNNLNTYFNSVHVKKKIGIVLSIVDCTKELEQYGTSQYVCVTHNEFIASIKQELGNYLTSTDDRHLLLLKDYILNFENMNNTPNIPELEKQLKVYQENAKNIQQLKEFEYSLRDYVIRSSIQAMQVFGFFLRHLQLL